MSSLYAYCDGKRIPVNEVTAHRYRTFWKPAKPRTWRVFTHGLAKLVEQESDPYPWASYRTQSKLNYKQYAKPQRNVLGEWYTDTYIEIKPAPGADATVVVMYEASYE